MAEAPTPPHDAENPPRKSIGHGESGMGIVYLAEPREPVRRRVARAQCVQVGASVGIGMPPLVR